MEGPDERLRIITSQIRNLIFSVDECFVQMSVKQQAWLLKHSYTVVLGPNGACMEIYFKYRECKYVALMAQI